MSHRSATQLGAILAVVATLIALGASEMVVRALDRVPAGIYEPDSAFLYRLAPGGRKVVNSRGRQFVVEIDSQGYRGKDFALRSPARRIAVFGDSFIAGEFSPFPQSFVERLRVEQSTRLHDSVEAINIGVAGYGPDQELLRMRGEFARLKPDLAVVALFPFNDFGDLLRNRLFGLDSSGALISRGGRLTDSMRTVFTREAHPTGWRRSQLLRLAEREIDNRLRRWRNRNRPPMLEFTRKALHVGDSTLVAYDNVADSLVGYEIFRDEYDADIAIAPESRLAQRKIALMAAVLRAIRDEASRAGVPLIVLVIPAPEDICTTFSRHADSTAFPTYVRSRLTDTAERLARDAGMQTVNFWKPFQAADPCSLYLGRGDNHWNDAGQALAARLLSDTIAARGLLSGKARAR